MLPTCSIRFIHAWMNLLLNWQLVPVIFVYTYIQQELYGTKWPTSACILLEVYNFFILHCYNLSLIIIALSSTVAPKKPTNFQYSEVTSCSVKLSWVQPYNTLAQSNTEDVPTKYHIKVADEPKFDAEIDGTSREYTLTGLQPGKTYRVILMAENSGGRVEADGISFRTPCESIF